MHINLKVKITPKSSIITKRAYFSKFDMEIASERYFSTAPVAHFKLSSFQKYNNLTIFLGSEKLKNLSLPQLRIGGENPPILNWGTIFSLFKRSETKVLRNVYSTHIYYMLLCYLLIKNGRPQIVISRLYRLINN